jgi:hypothetical protein
MDEICRSFWAKFGQSRSQTSIKMKIKRMKKKTRRDQDHHNSKSSGQRLKTVFSGIGRARHLTLPLH